MLCAWHATHVSGEVAAVALLKVPRAHSRQVPAPVQFLYAPVPQGAHGPPSGQLKPRSHVQFAAEELAAGAELFAAHAVHTADAW